MRNFASDKERNGMKTIKQYAGIILIVAGTFTLLLTRLQALSLNNTFLVIGLILIVTGIVIHIRSIKKESKY